MFRAIARVTFVLLAAAPLGASARPLDPGAAAPPVASARPLDPGEVQRQTQALDTTPQRSEGGDPWCREAMRNSSDDDRENFCEVREFTLGAGPVTAETSNGGIRVTGERRNDVFVRAMVMTNARTAARAREIAQDITVTTSGLIRATGPRMQNREGWHVSFRIQTPQSADLNLTSSNGSLSATDVRGRIRMRTSNGSIRLMDVGGDVQADTSNGSVNASLSGTRWEGEGLDVVTSNGSVRLTVPDGYNARLVAGTSNGSINVGFPIMVSGNIGGRRHDIDTTLGSGGPPIRVRTSNGSVTVSRPGAVDRDRDRQ